MQMQNVGHIQTKLTPKRSRVCVLQEILEIAIDIKQIVKNRLKNFENPTRKFQRCRSLNSRLKIKNFVSYLYRS